MPNFQDFHFTSSSGKASIHALKCVPDAKPRAVLQIAHGIAEHIDRYREFMEFLANNGIVVFGNDHLGHGKSISSDEDKGIFTVDNGWFYVVDDMVKLHDIARQEYPDVPYILFGHSMGSFLTRTFTALYPDKYDLAIISGTGHLKAPLVIGGNLMASILCKKDGVRADGSALDSIAFGSYLNRIEKPRTKFDWLSCDEAEVDKYVADPLCGFIGRLGLYRDLMVGVKFITAKANIAKIPKNKPVYFMSGAEDPVGDYGEGVERAYKAFCDAGLCDVFLRLYPNGRHEMLNELNKKDVYRDIINWINDKLKP